MLNQQILHSVVPHVTDAIMDWVERVARIPVDGDEEEPQVCIIEVYISSFSFACWFFLLFCR